MENKDLNYSISESLLSDLRILGKKHKVDVFSGDEETNFDFKDAVPSGIASLDMILGGGFYPGRIYEIFGEESHGKSTLSYHFMAQVQKLGGVVILIESESALDKERVRSMGVDTKGVITCQPDDFEGGTEIIHQTLLKIREANTKTPILIVWDTIAAAPPRSLIKHYSEGTNEYSGGMMEKPRLISNWMKVVNTKISKSNAIMILINQVYDSTGYGGGLETPGGHSMKHHATARLFVRRAGVVENSEKRVIGNLTSITTYKNKQAPPKLSIEVNLLFSSGFDSTNSILNYINSRKILPFSSNGWCSFKVGKKDFSFRTSQFIDFLAANPGMESYIKYLMYKEFYTVYPSLKERYEPLANKFLLESNYSIDG